MLFGSTGPSNTKQLTLMRFNEATTIGYIVELKDGIPLRLSARQVGGATASCLSPRGTADTHLYLPLHPGEWVKAVWVRGTRTRTSIILALIVSIRAPGRRRSIHEQSADFTAQLVLNTHRVLIAGSHVEAVNGVPLPIRYGFVNASTNRNEAIIAQLHLLEGLRGVICAAEWPPADFLISEGMVPIMPQTASSYPRGKRGEAFYLSVVELRPAASMRLAMDGLRVTGLLLTYLDGAEDALGRVCLAKLQPPERVYEDGIWILTELIDKYPQVVRIVVEKPGRNADRYLHVRWQGQLEWWSSVRQCEVHYLTAKTLSARP